jgi:hypothetical protein
MKMNKSHKQRSKTINEQRMKEKMEFAASFYRVSILGVCEYIF